MTSYCFNKLKRLSLVMLLALLFSALALSASAAEPEDVARVHDLANLMTDEEEIALAEKIAEAEQGSDYYFFVATYSGNVEGYYYKDEEYWGEDFLWDFGLSGSDDIILLIITEDRGTYYYDMYTYGGAKYSVSNAEVDRILDDDMVYDNLKSGRLYDGAVSFVSLSKTAAEGKLRAPIGQIIAVSAVLAVIVAGVVCGIVIGRYKMKIKPTNYPLDKYCNMTLTASVDDFKGTFVTRRRIPRNNGGSHGGSRSGGGGGHRGGR